jgi:hypothetical protein
MQTDTHLSPGKAVANVGKELHNTRDVQAVVFARSHVPPTL